MKILLEIIIKLNTCDLRGGMEIYLWLRMYIVILVPLLLLLIFYVIEQIGGTRKDVFT